MAAAAVAVLAACSTEQGLPHSGHAPVAHAEQTASQPAQPTAPITLATGKPRTSRGTVAAGGGDSHYNYAPAVIRDDTGTIRLWWCSQLGDAGPPGDDILYATARTADGPFRSPRAVFTGSRRGFDAMHTCDPSVVVVGGTYYLYYTGVGGRPRPRQRDRPRHQHGRHALARAAAPSRSSRRPGSTPRPTPTASASRRPWCWAAGST